MKFTFIILLFFVNSTIYGQLCFSNPDTSLSGIKLRDIASTFSVLGKTTVLKGDTTYSFYSHLQNETLNLTVHPGDYFNQVSIFNVKYSDKADHGYKELRNEYFETEKHIRLGISKQVLVKKLGRCYIAKDSTKGYMELYYRIELPHDSRTKLLSRQNMPIYYATYKFRNDKLDEFEFGFEYP
jgi:hypothetical protein